MRQRITWIGNKRSGKGRKEFHRIEGAGFNQPQGCQFSEIIEKNKVTFKRARDAREAGYDACSFCTQKFRSRR